jgi:N-acetyl-gamma-glutamyl-phosphate reductase
VTAADVPNLVKIDDVDFAGVDAVFCCLPHATTQKIIKALPEHLKIVDLSADFRLADVNTYAEWCAAVLLTLQLAWCTAW